jgi:hypothetical protein
MKWTGRTLYGTTAIVTKLYGSRSQQKSYNTAAWTSEPWRVKWDQNSQRSETSTGVLVTLGQTVRGEGRSPLWSLSVQFSDNYDSWRSNWLQTGRPESCFRGLSDVYLTTMSRIALKPMSHLHKKCVMILHKTYRGRNVKIIINFLLVPCKLSLPYDERREACTSFTRSYIIQATKIWTKFSNRKLRLSCLLSKTRRITEPETPSTTAYNVSGISAA